LIDVGLVYLSLLSADKQIEEAEEFWTMMNKLRIYALILLGVALGLLGLRFHWMRIAEERIAAEAARASNQRMRRSNGVREEIDNLGDAALRERASRWVRNKADD